MMKARISQLTRMEGDTMGNTFGRIVRMFLFWERNPPPRGLDYWRR